MADLHMVNAGEKTERGGEETELPDTWGDGIHSDRSVLSLHKHVKHSTATNSVKAAF
jgi:hypothetical protein